MSIFVTEDRRSPTRTPMLSTRFCVEHTGIPVHCLILSVQRLCGLPRRLFPATMPCRTYMQILSAQTTWPKYCSFHLSSSARRRHAGFNFSNVELLVLCRSFFIYSSVFCHSNSYQKCWIRFVFIFWSFLDHFDILSLYDSFYLMSIPLLWTIYVLRLTEVPMSCFSDFIMSLLVFQLV